MVNTEIHELKNILLDFIGEQKQFNKEQKQFNKEQKQFNKEQKQFNKEQKQFNKEQKQFNIDIDKKIDRVQYYLEETMASNTKMFFEEQMELKSKVEELNGDVFNLKNDLIDLITQVKLLQN